MLLALARKAATEQNCQHTQIPTVLKWVLFALSGAFLIVTSNSQPKLIVRKNAREKRPESKPKEKAE